MRTFVFLPLFVFVSLSEYAFSLSTLALLPLLAFVLKLVLTLVFDPPLTPASRACSSHPVTAARSAKDMMLPLLGLPESTVPIGSCLLGRFVIVRVYMEEDWCKSKSVGEQGG